MKALPLRLIYGDGYLVCSPEEATHVRLNMPGPIPMRIIPVQIKGTREGSGNWSWNGDTDSPTLRPSILTRGQWGEQLEGDPPLRDTLCHSWVNDGKVQFLDDCTHELAGQTLDLLEVK